MRRSLIGMAVLLATAAAVCGQQVIANSTSARNPFNTAQSFEETSAARLNLYSGTSDPASTTDTNFSVVPAADAAEAAPAFPGLPAAPAPKPKFVFGDRDDYRWQLGLGVEFFRFQSSLINASLVGTNTTITYFTNSWLGLEGSLVTGFAPQIYDREHVKYFGGSGGIRVGTRRARFEPWGHALIGGAHLQPQTANNSKNAFTVQAGIGLDFRVNARLSLRAETDWVRTQFFNDSQNNFQGAAGIVFHF